jgi:hypothetical protein
MVYAKAGTMTLGAISETKKKQRFCPERGFFRLKIEP